MPRVSKNRFGSWRCFSVLFLEVKVAMWGCCLGCVALFETMPNSWMLLLRGTWEATQLLKVLTKNALFGFDCVKFVNFVDIVDWMYFWSTWLNEQSWFRTHGGEGNAGSSNPKFRLEGSVLGLSFRAEHLCSSSRNELTIRPFHLPKTLLMTSYTSLLLRM